jgi:septal ring factor EnvC (AmiA/AmiB activator)
MLKLFGQCLFLALNIITFHTNCYAEDTQKQQSKIQKQISRVNSSLNNSRSKSDELENKVEEAEEKLNQLTKELYETEQSISRITTKLIKSNAQKARLQKQTDQQKGALAQQMQALYTSGKQSHLRLLLKQDDPSEISRTIKYFEYMNDHRLKRIRSIKTRLDKIKEIQDQINVDSKDLHSLQKKQSSKKTLLKNAVTEHENALKKQNKIVYSQEQKLAALRKEESRLQNVIRRLAQKRKAEDEAALREKTQQKKQTSKNGETVGASVERRYVPDKPFSTLRGKLAWPVKGRLSQSFGSSRNSKQSWKGVILSAPAGSNVYAVARGKVEFSGRLKGYGYLVIIRHDNNYRSLYAYNRSVYKKEGEIVKMGDIIAAVGSSGSQSNSGLYFEIRKSTTPQNPSSWCR